MTGAHTDRHANGGGHRHTKGGRSTHKKGSEARTHRKGDGHAPTQKDEKAHPTNQMRSGRHPPTHRRPSLPPPPLFTSLPSLPRPPNCFPSGLLQRFLSLLECRWKYRNSRKRGERATGNANLLKSWFSAKLRFTLRHEKILNLIDNFLVVDGALCHVPTPHRGTQNMREWMACDVPTENVWRGLFCFERVGREVQSHV